MSNYETTASRSFHLVINPASGGGTAADVGVALAKGLRAVGATLSLTYSSSEEQSRQVVSDVVARGEVVVAVGGDGMVNSIAGEVVRAGGVLGIAPAGRGNDFARQLGIDSNIEAVTELLMHGTERRVDVIDAGGRIVVGSVYAGIDSLASEIVNKAKYTPKFLQYQLAAVRALAASKVTTYSLTIDGTPHTFDGYTVIAANSGYYGAGMHPAPDAEVDDGLLDIVILGADSKLRLLRAMPKMYDGSHVGLDSVTILRGKKIRIEASSAVNAFGDGEYLAPLPLDVSILAGALTVIA